MALQSSGAISLDDIHQEVDGVSGTTCSINDSDIRGLIDKGAGATMGFNEWYGASNTKYIAATGGNTTTSGNYKYHYFNSSGTFNITQGPVNTPTAVDYIIIAGGGAGGTSATNQYNRMGGGGGAGGYITGTFTGNAGSRSITVGGGAGAAVNSGNNGSNSSISGVATATGGGGGGFSNSGSSQDGGNSGGSGGGGGMPSYFGSSSAGSGTSGQGNAGHIGNRGYQPGVSGLGAGGGGGGKGGAAQDYLSRVTAYQPHGIYSEARVSYAGGKGSTTGAANYNGASRAGGGGGGAYPGHGYYFWNNNPANPQYYDSYFRFPYGGRGRDQFNQPANSYNSSASGGGVGHAYSNVNSPYDNPDRGSGIVQVAASGTANTGGGGGGGAHGDAASGRQGGNGGSGIVMVRYQYQG